MKEKEQVLVIPVTSLPFVFGCPGQEVPEGFTTLEDLRSAQGQDSLDVLRRIDAYATWMDRDIAEKSPGFRQVIPYAVVMHGADFLCYRRPDKGGEPRLSGFRSMGFGGHVNPGDGQKLHPSLYGRDVYGCLHREMEEELGLKPCEYTEQLRGVINMTDTAVGRVHVGLVFTLHMGDPSLSAIEEIRRHVEERHEISELERFAYPLWSPSRVIPDTSPMPPERMAELEPWSSVLMGHIVKVAAATGGDGVHDGLPPFPSLSDVKNASPDDTDP